MGENLSPLKSLIGGDKTKLVTNKNATAARQQSSNDTQRQNFVNDYVKMFGGPGSNAYMQDSLRGYFGGQSLEDIANHVATTGTWYPTVKPVQNRVKVKDNSIFSSLPIPDPLSPNKGLF